MVLLCRNNATINTHVKTQHWSNIGSDTQTCDPTRPKSLTPWPEDLPSLVMGSGDKFVLLNGRSQNWTELVLNVCRTVNRRLLWPPYGIGQAIIFSSSGFYLLFSIYLSPNLSRRRLDVYRTSTHGVALMRI